MSQPRQEAEPRRHHYVPQCWLAGFTQTGEKDGRLYVTDFSRRAQWLTTPAGAGHIRDFYRLSDPAPDPVLVERFFSELENMAAPVLKAIDREMRPPTEDELALLVQFMGYQWIRVPAFRPLVLGVLDRMTTARVKKALRSSETWREALMRAGIDPNAPGTEYERMKEFIDSGEYSLEAETDWYLQTAFKKVHDIVDSLYKRRWHTSVTRRGRLIATDNPVVLDGAANRMIGFKNAEFVLYPISRRVLLTGTLTPILRPEMNFNYFARMNTAMLLRADAQVYSHVPDFVWMREDQKTQTDWKLFSKDNFKNIYS